MIESVNERMRLNAEVGAGGELCKGMGGGGRARQTIQPGCKLVLYPAIQRYLLYLPCFVYQDGIFRIFQYFSRIPWKISKPTR